MAKGPIELKVDFIKTRSPFNAGPNLLAYRQALFNNYKFTSSILLMRFFTTGNSVRTRVLQLRFPVALGHQPAAVYAIPDQPFHGGSGPPFR